MTITLKRTVNLSEPILPEVLPAPLYEGEKNAHTFMITAEKDKLPHALSGSVVAYFERNDGNTVRVEGETKDGAAILTLSPECYQTGVFYLAVMLISDGAQTVIYAASGRVRNTQDGEIIDGGNTIPTYDEIMAHLEKYLSTDITAKVEETEDGALITMKDVVNGETTAAVKNGKSAYEIAKENGFEGTEEEWLNSLKGAPGEDADIFIVHIGGGNVPDKTYAEIMEAYLADKTCICTGVDGHVFLLRAYRSDDVGRHFLFIAPTEYNSETGLDYQWIRIYENNTVKHNGITAHTPNPKRLIFTDENGEPLYEYDGSKETKVPNNGGSGGNLPETTDPHMMLVTDADGKTKWEERTHYSQTEIKNVELLNASSDDGSLLEEDGSFLYFGTMDEIVVGNAYTVTYNGTTYECVAQGMEIAENIIAPVLGNIDAIMGTGDNGLPFVFAYFSKEVQDATGVPVTATLMSLTGDTSASIVVATVKEVEEIKTIDEKYLPSSMEEIIFTKGADGQYTCNIPHVELWEMDAEAIAKNARIINGEEEYSVRGVSKETVSLYGNVIQLFADLNTIIYDLTYTMPQSLIITYARNAQTGLTTIGSHNAYSLNDYEADGSSPNIPIRYGKRWQNYALDFLEYTNTLNSFSLKTMSETTKGGAMVGGGLEVVDGVLRVKGANTENAGKLLFVNENGTLSPLTLGTGLKIVDGVLTIEASIAKAVAGMAMAGQVKVGEV